MLSNSIALIAVAALFGVEAWKAGGGIPRLILTFLAVTFALSGTLLQPLTTAVPQIGKIVADTFSQPASWFVLMIALFFVVRPLWSRPRVVTSQGISSASLCAKADNLIERLRANRKAPWRDPLNGIVLTGKSVLITFEKAGFEVPTFPNYHAENAAYGMLAYFSAISPLLREGHQDEARSYAKSIAEQAEKSAKDFSKAIWSDPTYDF